jgi:hypothetical protein
VDNASPYCSDCLLGKWELVQGVKLICNDTILRFDKGQVTSFWNGIREPDKIESHLILDFQNDNFTYDEQYGKDINGQDQIFKYTESWAWINTTESKTHLKLRLRWFFPDDEIGVLKIIELSDNKLILEHSSSWMGCNSYLLYQFKKAPDSPIIKKNNDQIISQLPLNILGKWSLVQFAIQSNDSVFTKYSNDTLVVQNYQYHYSHWTPGYYTKEISKTPYKLDISISKSGNLSSTTKYNDRTIDDFGYWYWIDNSATHENIYIDPSGCIGFNYKINRLDKDSLFIQNDFYKDFLSPTIYKFKRIK